MMNPAAISHDLIRLGEPSDGGYLVPNDLEGIVSCFSPGVAEVASFELALADLGINSYMADYSVDGPPVENPMFDFYKKFLGVEDDGLMFIRLDEWVKNKSPMDGDLILQMDIEGAEWPILADVSQETLAKFRIIVLELHSLDQMLTTVSGNRLVEGVFRKLRTGFTPVHVHPNNCCPPTRYQGIEIPPVLEVTLLRNDRIDTSVEHMSLKIPHPLDANNVRSAKAVRLPEYWYVD
jgi:hypothetical protein